jgi:hypothetical protein
MSFETHPKNTADLIIAPTEALETKEFICDNHYGRGGVFLITALDAKGPQQQEMQLYGTITRSGQVRVTVTSSIVRTNSKGVSIKRGYFRDVYVDVLEGDGPIAIATKIKAALLADSGTNDHYHTGDGVGVAWIKIRAKVIAETDGAFNFSVVNATSLGLKSQQYSRDTTGVGGGLISITPNIEGIDESTGFTYPLLQGLALAVVGDTMMMTVYPDITPAANVAAAALVPRKFKITMAYIGTDVAQYQVVFNANS